MYSRYKKKHWGCCSIYVPCVTVFFNCISRLYFSAVFLNWISRLSFSTWGGGSYPGYRGCCSICPLCPPWQPPFRRRAKSPESQRRTQHRGDTIHNTEEDTTHNTERTQHPGHRQETPNVSEIRKHADEMSDSIR